MVGGFEYVVCTSAFFNHDNETTRRALRAKGLLAEIWCIAVVSVCAAQLYFNVLCIIKPSVCDTRSVLIVMFRINYKT